MAPIAHNDPPVPAMRHGPPISGACAQRLVFSAGVLAPALGTGACCARSCSRDSLTTSQSSDTATPCGSYSLRSQATSIHQKTSSSVSRQRSGVLSRLVLQPPHASQGWRTRKEPRGNREPKGTATGDSLDTKQPRLMSVALLNDIRAGKAVDEPPRTKTSRAASNLYLQPRQWPIT